MKYYENVAQIIREKIRFPYKQGMIIFLNGPSSSGKTTLAKLLQKELNEPFQHFPLDNFLFMLHERYWKEDINNALPEIPKIIHGFHLCVAASAKAGNNLIVDSLLPEEEILDDLIGCLKDVDCKKIIFVGVKCNLEVLEERERKRPDVRESGLARYQVERVHKNCIYDVEVDTSASPPEESVKKIKDFYLLITKPRGFELTQQKFANKK